MFTCKLNHQDSHNNKIFSPNKKSFSLHFVINGQVIDFFIGELICIEEQVIEPTIHCSIESH